MRNGLPYLVSALVGASCCSAALAVADPPDPETVFAAAYMRELSGGDPAEAIAAYRDVISRAGTNAALAARALWRVGVSERLRERWSASREAWRTLVAQYPAAHPLADRARDALRELDRITERVDVTGRVLDADGQAASRAFLLIGDWITGPPILTDEEGRFAVERRASPGTGPGRRTVFVYAEHATRDQAMVAALTLTNASADGIVVRMRPTVGAEGRVTDPAGRPLAGVRVAVEVSDASAGVVLPCDAVLPAAVSDSNGAFRTTGLVDGLTMRFVAELDGYHRGTVEATITRERLTQPVIVLSPAGRAGVEGMVTDERGQPLDAVVSAYAFTPEETPVGSARTDLSGQFRLAELSDSPLTVVAQAAGFCERRVTGVRPGYRRVDFVLGRPGVARARPVMPGESAPPLDVVALNAASLTAGSLKHHPALLYFWSRPRPLNPPVLLEDLQRRYADAGLHIACIHDASALPEDLAMTALRQGVSYVMAIDRYAPATGTGVMHSATFDAFGARAGDVVAIDPQGLVAWRGRLHDPAAQTELEPVIAALVAEATPASRSAARRSLPRGAVVPTLRVRWVRGDPVSGAAPHDEDMRGRVVVYHFGSAFAESSRQDKATAGSVSLSLWSRAFGRDAVMCVWILPSGEGSDEVTQVALGLAPEAMVAVDTDGSTYRAFGAGETPENTVTDGEGRVRVGGCRDEQVFRAVKDALAARERFRD